MNEKNFKKIINQDSFIIIGIILMVTVMLSIGTYAYVTWSGKDTTGGLTTKIGDLATVIFDKGAKINTNNLTPVLNYQDGTQITFNVLKKLDADIYINKYLYINNIDEELINESLKYVLLESKNNNSFEIIKEDNFTKIKDNKLNLLENYKITNEITYYKLYIYIDGRTNNTNMQNKNLNITLNVGANKEYQENINELQTSKVETKEKE